MAILKPKRRLHKLARLLGVIALLSLYGIGSTQTGYLHQLFHPEEVATAHSTTQEQDPCHRALYHGMDTGCRHEFHLVKVHSCGLFHTLAHSDIALFDTASGVSIVTKRASLTQPTNQSVVTVTDSHLTRGPPVELHV